MRTDCIYLDSETCGFAGMAVLLQYAFDDGPIVLYDAWLKPIEETLELIEQVMDKTFVGFNLAFDHFHLCKMYTTFRLLPAGSIPANLPVLQVAEAEKAGRDGPCLKPKGAMDLMLHSRKGEHQSLMSRHDIRIRKVPKNLSGKVKDAINERVTLDPILKASWVVAERKNQKGVVSTEFDDVVLRFRPDRGLKSLAKHCLNLDTEFHSFKEVWPVREKRLAELKYAPFALACGTDWKVRDKKGKLKGYTWPFHIHNDIKHWSTNEEARRYGRDDVTYTRLLDKYFGYPDANDDDSILACMVAAVRWHGFTIDVAKTTELLAESRKVLEASPININRPSEVRDYIQAVMDPAEGLLLDKSTKKANLERIQEKYIVPEGEEPEECVTCFGEGCPRCDGRGTLIPGPTAASRRCAEILAVKAASKEIDQHSKLLKAGRFHASFKVIGTLSSRMAGGDGLNAQGIKKSKAVRSAFTLAWPGMVLCGGDFDSFEVTIADAVFQDPQMRRDLINGLSVHTVMAKGMYPDKTFEQILASKDKADGSTIDMYGRGKGGVFTVMYGGNSGTIARKLSIKQKIADQVFDDFQDRYPGVRESRERNDSKFSSMQQEGGIGTAIKWVDPDEYCETFMGFRRYFTLENLICKALYGLANAVPKDWHLGDEVQGEFVPHTCNRRDRQQTLAGAASSAIYGAAFQLQAANTRAANNHLIQSPGAQMTKRLQCAVWEFQPAGVHSWQVAPMNVHDEVEVVTAPGLEDALKEKVRETVEGLRKDVPLIGLKWETNQATWGEDIDKDDPRITRILHKEVLDDHGDAEADLPAIDEPFEEWADGDDDD